MKTNNVTTDFAEGCVPGPTLSILLVLTHVKALMSPDLQMGKPRHRESE